MSNSSNSHYPREKVLWMVSMPQVILLLVCSVWVWVSPDSNPIHYLKFDIKNIGIGIIVGIVLAGLGYLVYFISKKTKKYTVLVELFEDVLSPVFKNLKIYDLILMSFVSGFTEEIFFRGLVLPAFGLILSSVAFGVLHFPGKKYWFYTLWATLSGALLGELFILTKSLWVPITAHIVNNFIGLVLLANLKKKKK